MSHGCRGARRGERLFINSVLENKHRYNVIDMKKLLALFLATHLVANAQPVPKTMKAVVAHEYGGPEKLKLEEVPVPEPKENEVLVRVIASGVNPADPLILNGKFAKEFGTHLPLVLGYDMAGVVIYLSSRAGSYVSGAVIPVDGGISTTI